MECYEDNQKLCPFLQFQTFASEYSENEEFKSKIDSAKQQSRMVELMKPAVLPAVPARPAGLPAPVRAISRGRVGVLNLGGPIFR